MVAMALPAVSAAPAHQTPQWENVIQALNDHMRLEHFYIFYLYQILQNEAETFEMPKELHQQT